MIGEQLGNYRVIAKIGEGGMGAVYKAEHQTIGRRAAVKVLLPKYSARPDVIRRFFNEARAATLLRHPAFVDVFDYGIHDSGRAYIVMDFLDGETVAERLQSRGRLDTQDVVEVCRQLAAAMAVAHAAGIIHRDLKPENIFLIPDPEHPSRTRVKILDFGVAKLGDNAMGDSATGNLPRNTRAGMLLGTPVYMSPEQCRGTSDIDGRADIYALSAIAFTMLCRRPPFVRESTGELIAAHLTERPPVPSALEPSVPANLDDLIARGLAKNPADRPQTMKECERAFAQIAATLANNTAALAPAENRTADTLPATVTSAPGPRVATLPLLPANTTLSPSSADATSGHSRGRQALRAVVLTTLGLTTVFLLAWVITSQSASPPDVALRPAQTVIVAPPKEAFTTLERLQQVGHPINPKKSGEFGDTAGSAVAAVDDPAARGAPSPAQQQQQQAGADTEAEREAETMAPHSASLPKATDGVHPTAPPASSTVKVSVANGLPGLEVVLPGGRRVRPPAVLPRSGDLQRLRFVTPGMEEEIRSVRADRDHRIKLKNRQTLIIQ